MRCQNVFNRDRLVISSHYVVNEADSRCLVLTLSTQLNFVRSRKQDIFQRASYPRFCSIKGPLPHNTGFAMNKRGMMLPGPALAGQAI